MKRCVILSAAPVMNTRGLRQLVMAGQIPGPAAWAAMALWGGGLYLLGHTVFRKSRNRIIQKL